MIGIRPLEPGDLPDGMPMLEGRLTVRVINLGAGTRARLFEAAPADTDPDLRPQERWH